MSGEARCSWWQIYSSTCSRPKRAIPDLGQAQERWWGVGVAPQPLGRLVADSNKLENLGLDLGDEEVGVRAHLVLTLPERDPALLTDHNVQLGMGMMIEQQTLQKMGGRGRAK